jgi:transposase
MSYVQVQTNRDREGREATYVHVATSEWDAAKRRSAQRRLYVGKLDAGGTEVLLSKGFGSGGGARIALAELRERVASGQNVEAWLRLPAAGGGGNGDVPASVAVVGDAHVLRTLALETGLEETLNAAFGNDDGPALLGLAMHQTAEARPLYLAGDWMEDRELPDGMKTGVGPGGVYGLVGRVGESEDSRERFFRSWFHRHRSAKAVVCDTTSISTYAVDLELAEYGHNRDADGLRQVNLCLVADRVSSLPLWCRTLPGSIPDVSTLIITTELLRDLGLEEFSTSLDRGFYSQANVKELLRSGLAFVIGVPFSVALARNLVRKHRAALGSPKRSFPANGRVMRHCRDTWTVTLDQGETRTLDVHVYFEPERHAERATRLEQAVFALEEKAAKEKFVYRSEAAAWLAENAGALARCLTIRPPAEAGGMQRLERKPRAIARAVARMGYTVLLSSACGLPPEEILADYRNRDRVEKLFDSLKNEDGQRRLRTGVDANAEGRLFLAFTALVLRAALEEKMRKAGLLRKMTVAELLAQTRKIRAVTTLSGRRFLLEIPRRTRDVLESLGIPLPA